jgi:hypothetical protein
MSPKEKAQDLVKKFTWQREEHEKYVAKEVAKTCVDEIIKLDGDMAMFSKDELKYWEDVKAEIERL